jgi:hypothetical protein
VAYFRDVGTRLYMFRRKERLPLDPELEFEEEHGDGSYTLSIV